MDDWVNLSHSREHIAAIIISTKISDEIVEKVHHQFKLSRSSPLDTVLDIIREEGLIDADLQKIADYAVSHWANPTDTTAPDPAFFIVLDERTAQDSTVLFVSQFPEPGEVETIRIEAYVTINLRSVIMIKNPNAIEEYSRELVAPEDVYTDGTIPTDEERLLYNYAIVLIPREHLRTTEDEDMFVLDKEKCGALGIGGTGRMRSTATWEKVDRDSCIGFQGRYKELVGAKGLQLLTHMDYAL
jgi:hypothetical protein